MHAQLSAPRLVRAPLRIRDHSCRSRVHVNPGVVAQASSTAALDRQAPTHEDAVEGELVEDSEHRDSLERLFLRSLPEEEVDGAALAELLGEMDKIGSQASQVLSETQQIPQLISEVKQLSEAYDHFRTSEQASFEARSKAKSARGRVNAKGVAARQAAKSAVVAQPPVHTKAAQARAAAASTAEPQSALADAQTSLQTAASGAVSTPQALVPEPFAQDASDDVLTGSVEAAALHPQPVRQLGLHALHRGPRGMQRGSSTPHEAPLQAADQQMQHAQQLAKKRKASEAMANNKAKRLTGDQIVNAIRRVQAAGKIQARMKKAEGVLQETLSVRRFAQIEGIQNFAGLNELLGSADALREQIRMSQSALVSRECRRMMRSSSDATMEDLEEGAFGAVDRAIDKFDPELGYKFSTFAVYYVKQGALKALKENTGGPFGHTDANFYEAKQMLQMKSMLTVRLGRAPSHREIGNAMGMTEAKVERLSMVYKPVKNLSAAVGRDGEGDSHLDNLTDEEVHQQSDERMDLRQRQQIDLLRHALNSLPWREALLLRLRFGMLSPAQGQPTNKSGTPRAASLAECAAVLNLSKERVRNMEHRALRNTRALLRDKPVSLVDESMFDQTEVAEAPAAGYTLKA